MYRVINVRGLNSPEQRRRVCYVGRRFAGWPMTVWGNHGRRGCSGDPSEFELHLRSLPPAELETLLVALKAATDDGARPLGCWCGRWQPGEPAIDCHAHVWAKLLLERFPPDAGTGGVG